MKNKHDPSRQQHPNNRTVAVELLSPARNIACGIAAINHGADAVYIGGPKFSARAAAGNSIADIGRLTRYAHTFSAKVYVALNTILADNELDEALTSINQLYETGIDALIIQDLGLLECDLPPIPLHASTQTDNRSIDKVHFLEQVGFQQVVLARELHLDEIRAIRAATSVPLEFFIHGSLCVSYSGQCFLSEVMCGRSANRGECAQFCRHQFNLKNSKGEILEKDRYLLSLKDLEHLSNIETLLDAGITSLKIEGRLKDEEYVKNITALYRDELDRIFKKNSGFGPASSGKCSFGFIPDPARSFQRGKTDYFLTNRSAKPGSPDTVKSLGAPVGTVVESHNRKIVVDSDQVFANGDGLCFFDRNKKLVGIRVNRAEGKTLHLHVAAAIQAGTALFRNHDESFSKILQQSNLCRTIQCDAEIYESPTGLVCRIQDEDGCISETGIDSPYEIARNPDGIKERIEKQMRKTGGTVFSFRSLAVQIENTHFHAVATVNELRRTALDHHLDQRLSSYQRSEHAIIANDFPWPENEIIHKEAVLNTAAVAFYKRHGLSRFTSLQDGEPSGMLRVMTCRYCLRRQIARCPRMTRNPADTEPLYIEDNAGRYEVRFNCGTCEMSVYVVDTKKS